MGSTTYETRECLYCKKEFNVEPWRKQRFCSVKCGYSTNKGVTTVTCTCPECGRQFKQEGWRKHQYCSVKCGAVATGRKKRGTTQKRTRIRGRRAREVRVTKDGRRLPVYRAVIEESIGRKLKPSESVHHIDMNKLNNDRGNLHLFKSESDHQKAHRSVSKLIAPLLKKGVIVFGDGKYILASMKKLLLVLVIFACVGCITIPQATVKGAKVLKKGVAMVEKDYAEFGTKLETHLLSPTEDTLKSLKQSKAGFDRIMKALKIAVDAQCDAVIVFGGEEK